MYSMVDIFPVASSFRTLKTICPKPPTCPSCELRTVRRVYLFIRANPYLYQPPGPPRLYECRDKQEKFAPVSGRSPASVSLLQLRISHWLFLFLGFKGWYAEKFSWWHQTHSFFQPHTIVLVQFSGDARSRSWYDYDSISAAMDCTKIVSFVVESHMAGRRLSALRTETETAESPCAKHYL